MVRNILAVIVAFIGGGIFVFSVEAIGHVVYPLPAGLDMSKPDTIAEYVKNAPIGAILFVLLAQSAGSLGGGFIAGLISRGNRQRVAIIYSVLALLMACLNLWLIPHPLWFIALSIALPVPLALVGSHIGSSFVSEGYGAESPAA